MLTLNFFLLKSMSKNNMSNLYSSIKSKIKKILTKLFIRYINNSVEPILLYETLNQFDPFDLIFVVGGGTDIDQFVKHSPKAKFHIFEPNPINFKLLKNRVSTQINNFEVHQIALGASNEKALMTLNSTGSSLNDFNERWVGIKNSSLEKIEIDMMKLDSFAKSRNLNTSSSQKILLAIDTEGSEVSVLKGASEFLKNVDIIIAESRIIPGFTNSYSFDELISFINKMNFSTGLIAEVGPPWKRKNKSDNQARVYRYLDILFFNKSKFSDFYSEI